MSNLIERLKKTWKFNIIISLITVFIADALYLIAYFIIQTFFINKGHSIELLKFTAEASQTTIILLTIIVFIQMFILSWIANFKEQYEDYGNKKEDKIDKINW